MDSSPELNRQKRSPRKAESLIWGEDAEGQEQQTLCGRAQGGRSTHQTPAHRYTGSSPEQEPAHSRCTQDTRCSAPLEGFNPDSPHQLLVLELSNYLFRILWDFTLNPKLQWFFFLCSKTFPWECLRNVTQHVLLKKKNLFFFYMKHVYLTRKWMLWWTWATYLFHRSTTAYITEQWGERLRLHLLVAELAF